MRFVSQVANFAVSCRLAVSNSLYLLTFERKKRRFLVLLVIHRRSGFFYFSDSLIVRRFYLFMRQLIICGTAIELTHSEVLTHLCFIRFTDSR